MDVFDLRRNLVDSYANYIRSFIQIRDTRIEAKVREELNSGLLWPEPLIQLNPSFEPGRTIDELVDEGVLHPTCRDVFRIKKSDTNFSGHTLRLHLHQEEAIRVARRGVNYVLTTGTGSGKSLAYMIPIVDHVLRQDTRPGISAIVVYPMNALANSQYGELEKYLLRGFPDKQAPVRFATYTGQEGKDRKDQIIASPPDILLTNYVMLELDSDAARRRQSRRRGQGPELPRARRIAHVSRAPGQRRCHACTPGSRPARGRSTSVHRNFRDTRHRGQLRRATSQNRRRGDQPVRLGGPAAKRTRRDPPARHAGS